MNNLFAIRLGVTFPNGLQEFELRNVHTGATYTICGAVTKQPEPHAILAPVIVALPSPAEQREEMEKQLQRAS